MDAESFYDEFKEALKYLGVSWGSKYLVKVSVENDSIILSYKTKSVMLKTNVENFNAIST